ncbi:cupin domain-containing protein [Bradyrhizobium sp. RDM4]|uniref:cupin domain-containing protein n=1 Tax=Bradyrhizobium sp. RDM4 TaxID=3378765 RepID=UPI0038FCA091
MSLALIEAYNCNVDLKSSPIDGSQIIEGNPEAREHVLSTSLCGTAKTMIWSCTEGKFHWYYELEETIIILEGSIVIETDGMPLKRYGVGDVISFRKGAHAKWHVEGYVKKIAFLRQTTPVGFGFAIRAVNRIERFLRPGPRSARVVEAG